MSSQNAGARRIRGTRPEVETAARELRRDLTEAESVLWQALRGGQLGGLKFRRQHPVGQFILDFYCSSHKLAVELDGAIHEGQTEYDAARTRQLESHGYRVLRFRNEEVLADLDSVLKRISEAAQSLSASQG